MLHEITMLGQVTLLFNQEFMTMENYTLVASQMSLSYY